MCEATELDICRGKNHFIDVSAWKISLYGSWSSSLFNATIYSQAVIWHSIIKLFKSIFKVV